MQTIISIAWIVADLSALIGLGWAFLFAWQLGGLPSVLIVALVGWPILLYTYIHHFASVPQRGDFPPNLPHRYGFLGLYRLSSAPHSKTIYAIGLILTGLFAASCFVALGWLRPFYQAKAQLAFEGLLAQIPSRNPWETLFILTGGIWFAFWAVVDWIPGWHELLHALSMLLVGAKGVHFGHKTNPYTSALTAFTPSAYIFVTLAPLAFTVILLGIACGADGGGSVWAIVFAVANFGSMLADWWTVYTILREKRSAYYEDTGDGFKVFVKDN